MAPPKLEDDDSLVVSVDDADVIVVEGEDNNPPEPVIKAEPVVKEKRTRTRVQPDPVIPDGPSPEEALAQAQAYSKQQEDARKAAEATAANERAMREQAQRQATQAQQAAEAERDRANNSELTVLENGIAAATREIEAHEAEYTRAAEAGEFAKMATIQTKLSRAAAALDRLETAKSTFDVTRRSAPEKVDPQPQQVNVFENFLSQFAPAAQTWLRQHPECAPPDVGGNATKNSKMLAGHYAALGQGIQTNTPEYFRVIETHLDDAPAPIPVAVASKAAEIQQAVVDPKPVTRAQPSAPVSREPPASPQAPRNAREVRLTKEQQEMAKVSFPHLPEQQAYGQYARNLIDLEAEGKIGRLTH